mgnify:CR=1 FL=1
MDTWTRIERGGFYPRAVKSALRRALGGAEPLATLCQVDTGFDRGAVFRHLTIASLTERAIIQLHVDEMEGGSVSIATAVRRASDIAGYSTMEVYADPENASGLTEMTIALDLGGARRLEIEAARPLRVHAAPPVDPQPPPVVVGPPGPGRRTAGGRHASASRGALSRGTIIGAPVAGHGRHRQLMPYTSSMSSAVTMSPGGPWARILPPFITIRLVA